MIISPPFLSSSPSANDAPGTDPDVKEPSSQLMATQAPEGAFPLSYGLCWHNGVHLVGTPANGECPVRAISDGEVIFVGKPVAENNNSAHPQNLNPFSSGPSWTDNGCVILKHATEIGARGETPTKIVFYSAYMHLSRLARITPPGGGAPRLIKLGDTLWRKDEVGQAGKIYGHGNQCHLEICFDDDNIKALIGREPAWVDPANIPAPTEDGRVDAVFGAMWFYLKANTPTVPGNIKPSGNLRGSGQGQLNAPLWVKMTYERGDCKLESYDNTGRLLGQQSDPGFEYNLYKEACDRHNSLPQSEKSLSSPSGWYELLRFGRNLGRGPAVSEKDPLPSNAAHWRKIVGPTGQVVWADLNAEGSYKFSDADFLPIAGWNFVNDDETPSDQRCDSNRLKELIADPNKSNPTRLEPKELAKRLGNVEVKAKLRRVVSSFPTEFDQETIAGRYDFVKELDAFKQAPTAWDDVQVPHIKALSFQELDKGYLKAKWNFHPIEFIRVMRKCGWLSKRELAQLIPANVIRKPGGHNSASQGVWESPNLLPAQALIRNSWFYLNNALMKFGINTTARQACFFGNATQETAWFSTFQEGNGNSPNLHNGWYGRGFLQLTNPSGNLNGGNNNYYKYFMFSGKNPHLNPGAQEISWRNEIGVAPMHASQSAGAYWVWPDKTNQVNDTNIYADKALSDVNKRKTIQTQSGVKVWYYNRSFVKCATAVNYPGAINEDPPNMNGLVDRSTSFVNALMVLSDTPVFEGPQGEIRLVPEGFIKRIVPWEKY